MTILRLPRRLRKNQTACLLLAHRVLLILFGDEFGNTQFSNNNAYCQDNDVGSVKRDELGRDENDLTAFLGQLSELRRRFPQVPNG